MYHQAAKDVANCLHHIYQPFVRAPDFRGFNGYYVQLSIDARTFLIKGEHSKNLILREIGLGSSAIGWRDLLTGVDVIELMQCLRDIKAS